MKEKTFEELIKEHEWYTLDDDEKKVPLLDKSDVLDLLQQVRKATIAECHLIADKYYFQNSEKIIIDINSLPTDRIKTDL